MRDYARVAPQFWTGATGKAIRAAGRDVQVLAFYLVTCPSATMIGIYYLPIPTVVHETGLTLQGASKALRSLSEAGFAFYDDVSEHVYVPEMARYQIGDHLTGGKKPDKRIAGVVQCLLAVKNTPFLADFVARYREDYALDSAKRWPELARWIEGAPKGLPSPSEARNRSRSSREELKEQPERVSQEAASSSSVLQKPPMSAPSVLGARVRLPQPFDLTPERRAVAVQNGCAKPEIMHAQFVDYWLGTGQRKEDWLATYRNWARNGHNGAKGKECPCGVNLKRRGPRGMDAIERELAELDAEDAIAAAVMGGAKS